MFQRNFFLLFLTLIFLVSCGGKKSSNVNLELKGSLLFGGTVLAPYSTGGLMIWGKAQTGESFSKVLRNSETFNISLPNSVWRFYAMAWESSGALELQADNGLRCALTSPTELKGGDSNVSLNLSSATCDTAPEFRGNLTSLASMNLNIHTCEDVTNFDNVDDRCRNDRNGGFYKSDKAPVMSVKIILEAYGDKIEMPTEEGLSRCFPFPSVDEAMVGTGAGNLVIPQGNPANPSQSPFRVTLLYDLETVDCSAPAARMIKTSLNSGIAQVPANIAVVTSGNSLHLAEAISDTRLCMGRENLEPFAGGNGTDFFPHLICSERQLYNIHDSVTYNNFSYRLGKSLNLFNYMIGSNVDTSLLPADYTCWDYGQTWQPIGLTYLDCDTPVTGTDSFNGNFDGNGHTIEGMNMRYEGMDHIGLFSRWEAVTAGQYIRDLKLKKSEISANKAIGALFGSRGYPSDVIIEGIELIGIELEARDKDISDMGGLFGYGEAVELKNIRVLETVLKYEGSNVGGVFGRITQSLGITKIYSAAHIIPRYRNGNINKENLGGIGGSLVAFSLPLGKLQELSHEGILESISLNTGGLFGSLSSNQPLSYFYANSSIMASSDENHSVGGIVGRVNSTMTLSKGYFSGSIIDRCITGCMRGLIFGSKDGPATITGADLFAYFADQPATIGGGDAFNLAYLPDDMPNLNSVGTLYDIAATTSLDAPFIRVQGALPRLLSDKHPCVEVTENGQVGALSLFDQRAQNLGSSTRPLRICRKDQMEALGAMPSGVIARIYGGVNLSGSYNSPFIQTNVEVDGKLGFLYGYNKEGVFSDPADVFAPINESYGRLKNIKLGNIQTNVTNASLSGVSSGFLKRNYGLVDNVSLLTGIIKSEVTTILMKTAGLVSFNHGTIKNSEITAYLTSPRNLSGFVTENFGEIHDSIVVPTIIVDQPTQDVFGVVDLNQTSGTIARINIGGVLESNNEVDKIFLIANQNSGVIEDIEISSGLRWLTGINGPFATVANINLASGVIRRIIMKGQFLNTNNTISTITPTYGKNVVTNGGTVAGVYTFSPIGRKIFEIGTTMDHICTGNVLELDPLYYTPPTIPFGVGDDYFVNDSTIGDSKHVWIVVEIEGQRNAAIVTGLTNANPITLNLGQDCDDIRFNETGARVNIIQAYDNTAANVMGDYTVSPFNGVVPLFSFDATALDNPVWSANFIDPDNNPADFELILDYFMAEILGLPPVSIPPWELELARAPSLISVRN